ncbi:olfactory receptor 5B21-like isoform X1 [Xenopus tropicalis]|uniref:Olfactory receptor n=1 Tax=Xenopus tropicalis TaxID=8364 RepID=A0A803JX07_XENTR|nr:olfactory receptor 5B21-like isoform X1 [Xenopus tropicalis]XP_031747533.1 olfactory receptor 5B21-like isoform X1 [Xenopus tropicalis]
MEAENYTAVPFFIIKGISDNPKFQAPIFILVLLIYLFAVGGNIGILFLVGMDSKLHNPMYFFLGNLSVLDISSITVTLHKTLAIFLTGNKTLSFPGCITQVYFFMALECTELLILAAMSLDRYAAICNPLHYPMIMNPRTCAFLASVCWVLGFIEVIPHAVITNNLSCYTSNEINHFFCDVLPLMKISCSDTSLLKLWIVTEGVFVSGVVPLVTTLVPYIFIIRAILKVRSTSGRQKAFYTCSSHVTLVIVLYLTLYCLYLTPSSENTLDSHKLFSLFNTAAVPILNPLIYSLKNKDVKSAVKRQLHYLYCKMIYPLTLNFKKCEKHIES